MVKICSWFLVFVFACFVGADIALAKGGGHKKGKESVDDLFKAFDKNKDGKLSKDEFEQLVLAQAKKKAARAFKKADANYDGSLSLDELKAALEKKGGKKGAS